MAKATTASMPAGIELDGGYKIRLTAIDPSTGNVVSGITVGNLVLAVSEVSGSDVGNLAVGPYLLVPGSGA